MNSRKLCIVGAGGFGRETLCCVIDRYGEKGLREKVCFMVDDKYMAERELMGVDVIKRSEFIPQNYEVVVAIGDPNQRKKIVENLPKGTMFTKIVHPTAIISNWVEIGEGSIITGGVVLTCGIKIGKHAHLNLHTTIGHDCEIGDYFTTAPGAKISGNCAIENNVYLGTNASIKQGITITSNVTIGMGSVVLKDVNESGVYVGSPIRKLMK